MRTSLGFAGETPLKDHAPAAAREQVRQAAADIWRRPVRVLYLRTVRPRYEVPGRRQDGTEKGRHLVRRFFRNLSRIPVLIFWVFVNSALNDAGDDTGNDLRGAVSTYFRKGAVRGRSADCAALPCADAAKAAKRHLWLAWSEAGVALMRATADGTPRTLWSAHEVGAPQVTSHHTLRWPDGSSLALPVDLRERWRFSQFDGQQ